MAADNSLFMPSFAEIVRLHGDRQAVLENLQAAKSEPITLTYRELDAKARLIGTALVSRGVAAGDVVGICIEKSADYICALLGIWHARAAFVPLDPGLPIDRVDFICAESSIKFILTNDQTPESLKQSNHRSYEPLVLSILSETSRQSASDEPVRSSVYRADDLAYVIFTSGSTGRPKGVEVLHRGLCNVLKQQIKAFELDYQSRSLWYLSTSFDASVSDLGTALLAGACLVIEAPCRLQPGAGLEEVLLSRQISYVDIPPSMLRLLNPATLSPHLKTIVIGGEKCALDVVRQFAAKVNLVNVYGPTEATICTSLGRCQTTWQKSLIGQPLDGVTYYLFDEQLKEVPAGLPGQLHIGGICLAKGYLHRPELNEVKFVAHPVSGERIYCTGDLVQLSDDGEYEFIGRIDRQFKLRGMLIEPEEIESRLLENRTIKHAAVLKRPVKDGVNREILIAFIVLNDVTETMLNQSDVIQLLRDHLEDCLPAWMMPQRFEVLNAMPMTKTGKIDMSALRKATLAILATKDRVFEQGNEDSIAARLKDVFEQSLGVDNINLNDDFFDIGGDSFAVVEATVIASALGLVLPPTLLMTHPTISALTESMTNSDARSANIANGGMTTVAIRDDIRSYSDISRLVQSRSDSGVYQNREPEQVLLTGASGFLGSRLLQELLKDTSSKIHCLVRAESDDEALQRIKSTFKKYGLVDNQAWQRVVAIAGNLEVTNFGLNQERYDALSKNIDTIFHCAAQVNNLASYETLRPPNVEGTAEILRLMARGRVKCLHYASTLSVFVATENNRGVLLESDHLSTSNTVFGGYAQTKFAAEILLRQFNGALGPISYHRFGLITGDSQSGIGADNDFLNLFCKGLKSLNYAPEMEQKISIDITPIDFAARAMLRLSLHCMQIDEFDTFHIANSKGLEFSVLLNALQKYESGTSEKLQILPVPQFKRRLLERISMLGTAESAACLALCRITDDDFRHYRTMDLFQATDVIFDMQNANKILAPISIICPAPSETLVNLYLQRILRQPSLGN